AERHEVAGYMGSEQPLQAEKAGGVHETAGEAQQSGKRVASHHSPPMALARPDGPPISISAGQSSPPCAILPVGRIFSTQRSHLGRETQPCQRRFLPAFCRRLWPERYIKAVLPR